MMSSIIIYAIACAAALTLFATCLDHICARCHRPRRQLWALAMLASLLLPSVLIWQAGKAPEPAVIPVPTVSGESTQWVPNVESESRSSFWGGHRDVASSQVASIEVGGSWRLPTIPTRYLVIAWMAISALLICWLATAALVLRRRATTWSRESILGHDVLVSDDTGPALIGALRPWIVVPRWFVAEPAGVQRLILEHEIQHIVARDPLLMRAAMLVAIAVPWNLPLWWQLYRLRLCIELDCDARVLKSGADAFNYAEVLLGVVRRAVAMPIGVVAMSEPASALAQRIRAVTSAPRRYAPWVVAGGSALAVAGAALVASLDIPVLPRLHVPQAVVTTADAPQPAPSEAQSAGGEAPSVRDETSSPVPHAVATPVSSAPRLPPPESNLLPPPVARALVARFPQLFAGQTRPGLVLVALVLRPDGQVYLSKLVPSATRDPNGSVQDLNDAISRDMGESATGFLKSGTVLLSDKTLKSNLAVRYAVLPQGFDALRTSDVVKSSLIASHQDLFLPVSGEQVNRVTVFMTNDGQIDKLYTESRTGDRQQPLGKIDPDVWAPMWEPLGLLPEQLGLIGMTYLYSDSASAPDRKWMIVRYAFPRRAGEPVGGFTTTRAAAISPDTFDSQSALAVVTHYLPEALKNMDLDERAPDEGIPAIALSGNGQVIKATRVPSRFGFSPEAVRALQDQLAPGVQLTRFVARPVRAADGAGTTVLFAWDTSRSR